MGWSTVNNVPASIDTMLLLTDGSVMAHVLASSSWYRLIPDNTGSYANGTWKQTASMLSDSNLTATMNGPTYGPVFFGSAVLQDGTLIVYGGEYNVQYSSNSNSVDALEVQLYDPTTDSWIILSNPPGWTNIGDPASSVLADGRVLFGNPNNAAMALFDPQTQTYLFTSAKNDNSSEETLTLLPTGDVLDVQCSNGTNAEMYTPLTDVWLQMGSTGVGLPQPCPKQGSEIGPAILMPNGNVFAIGASGNTTIYAPGAAGALGTWSNGPMLVDSSNNTLFPMDAPAVLLTNGRVMLTASPSPPCSYPGPTTFFLYDSSTNKATITTGPSNNGGPCFEGRFLLLPSGEVLYSNQSSTVSILDPVGGAQANWAPTITNCPNLLIPGHTYQIFGTQFNGLSQACSYGDDAQMATNYPIVRLQDSSNNIFYLRTANHSTMAVATGTATVSTFVSVPTDVAPGQYNLFVVANGIASAPLQTRVVLDLGGISTKLAVGINDHGYSEVFCLNTAGNLWHINDGDDGWSPWQPLGGTSQELAVSRNHDGHLEVFCLNSVGELWHIWYQGDDEGWSNWSPLGGTSTQLAVGLNDHGYCEVFCLNSAGNLWHINYGPEGWSAWQPLGGVSSELAVAKNEFGHLEVFCLNTVGELWHIWYQGDGNGWSNWASLGGTSTAVAVTRNAGGHLEVFTLNSVGELFHCWYGGQAAGWSGWAPLGGVSTALSVTQDGSGNPDVFCVNSVGNLWHIEGVPGWSPWEPFGGTILRVAAINDVRRFRVAAFCISATGQLLLFSHTTKEAATGVGV